MNDLTLSSLRQSISRPADWQDVAIIICLLQFTFAFAAILKIFISTLY